MADRFSAEHGVDVKKADVGFVVDMSPTDIETEEEMGGYLRTTKPVGGDPKPARYQNGQAGASDSEYNESA